MNVIWIILTSALSAGACAAGGLYLGIFLSDRNKNRFKGKLVNERDNKLKEARIKSLGNTYFELKNNIFLLSDIQELIKNKNIAPAKDLLEEIRVEQVFNISKNIRMSRSEFEVVDELYLPRLFKNKIGFYINLYMENKLSLLELRAEVDRFMEELKITEKKFKDIFIGAA